MLMGVSTVKILSMSKDGHELKLTHDNVMVVPIYILLDMVMY